MDTQSIVQRKRRVVVTGVGIIAPNGIGKFEFWENCLAGKSGVVEVEFAKKHVLHSTVAGVVENFNPKTCDRGDNNDLDRYIQFALAATRMAVDDAGINFENEDSSKIGVCVANAICGTRYMEQDFLKMTQFGKAPLDPNLASPSLYNAATFNIASVEIAQDYNLKGPICTLPTGCAAGLDAIGFSLDAIRAGNADVMITGASEAPVTPMVMAAFDAIGALSSRSNHEPLKASRPYNEHHVCQNYFFEYVPLMCDWIVRKLEKKN